MLTIFGTPVSVHTRKVIVVALEKHLEFRNESVIPFRPPRGWAEMSPTGKIPVVTDGEHLLRDSSAICAYLERLHATPALYPSRPAEYAHSLFLEEYADGTVFPELVRPLFFQKVIRPQIFGQHTDQQVIEHVQGETLPRVLGYLESEIDRPFLVGSEFSIADVALMSNLLNFHYLGLRIDTRFPRLRSYFLRHLTRPSFDTAIAAERNAAEALKLDLTAFAA